MPLDYRFHPEAEREFEDGVDRWLVRDPRASERFLEAVVDEVDRVREFPGLGILDSFGTRSLAVHRFPFRLVYRVIEDVIEIVAVAHTSRRPGSWADRLR